ncbi:MAG: hypothetical protein AAF528_13170, partial [Cyanobacteria bacterium P01_C01_bin.121]
LEKNFGLSPREWTIFTEQLTHEQARLLELKQQQLQDPENGPSDHAIAQQLNWTPKRVSRRWSKLIGLAWKVRNQAKSAAKPVTKSSKAAAANETTAKNQPS